MRVREVVILREVADDLYAIYYEVADEIAYVVAVLPMRRHPAWIKGKLEGRG